MTATPLRTCDHCGRPLGPLQLYCNERMRELTILNELQRHHVGPGNAITREALAKVARCGDRRCREAIEHLKREGYPIRGGTAASPGYFLSYATEDVLALVSDYRGRALSMLATASALLRNVQGKSGVQLEIVEVAQ